MRTQRRLSDSEREQRRERDRERLKQAAEQLLTSEGWQRWVRVRCGRARPGKAVRAALSAVELVSGSPGPGEPRRGIRRGFEAVADRNARLER